MVYEGKITNGARSLSAGGQRKATDLNSKSFFKALVNGPTQRSMMKNGIYLTKQSESINKGFRIGKSLTLREKIANISFWGVQVGSTFGEVGFEESSRVTGQ